MEVGLVIFILLGAILLFALERYPADLVALMVLAVLTGLAVLGPALGWFDSARWIVPEEGLSGFSSPATITVAAMFVLSAGLQKTGAMDAVGRALMWCGRNQILFLSVIMISVGVMSAFINNTAAVAVFLPIVISVCNRHDFSPSKLLIPLSFASQFGGVCTLIGTSTNLLVNSISKQSGQGGFSMFEFTELGLILMAAGIGYFLLIGYWLLPSRRTEDQLTKAYGLGEYITEVRVLGHSPLIGTTVMESKLGGDVAILAILRGQKKIWSPLYQPLQEGDILIVRAGIQELMRLKKAGRLEIEPEFKLRDETLQSDDLILVEALVAPRSRLIGQSLADLDFRHSYNAIVLAIQRRGHTITEKLNRLRLRFGDALLLQGRISDIDRLRRDENFVVLEEVAAPARRQARAPLAVTILIATVGLAALNIMPIMVAAVLGALAMVLVGALRLEEAYQAIDWKVVFLLAGILPLGLVLERSGAAESIAHLLVVLSGQYGPSAALAAIYLLTVVLTAMMSNNATAVLLAPLAISTAIDLNVSPKPFLLAVMFAASTCFATPMGYQTNLMVYNPGGYRFADFVRVGLPLNLLFCLLAIYLIPQLWPF